MWQVYWEEQAESGSLLEIQGYVVCMCMLVRPAMQLITHTQCAHLDRPYRIQTALERLFVLATAIM